MEVVLPSHGFASGVSGTKPEVEPHHTVTYVEVRLHHVDQLACWYYLLQQGGELTTVLRRLRFPVVNTLHPLPAASVLNAIAAGLESAPYAVQVRGDALQKSWKLRGTKSLVITPSTAQHGVDAEEKKDGCNEAPKLVVALLTAPLLVPWWDARGWSCRVLAVAANYTRLVSLNAYVSTLGGGHFLCRHVEEARQHAILQFKVAQELGDKRLMARCIVHMIYNDIQTGHFLTATRKILKLSHYAQDTEDEELQVMLHAANVYMQKLRHLNRQKNLLKATKNPCHDELYRQRIVRREERK